MKMETAHASETSLNIYHNKRSHLAEDSNIHSHYHKNLKSHNNITNKILAMK
jgi:hypothetical protein